MDERTQKQVRLLEDVLRRMTEEHAALATLIARKRDALRQGRERAMDEMTQLEHEKLGTIASLEKQRAELAGELTAALEPEAREPMRVRELAERMDEPARGRLLVLGQELREKMEAVRAASSVTRQASEALLRHVQGVMQTVGMLSTGVSTYGSKGGPTAGATAVRTLNVTA